MATGTYDSQSAKFNLRGPDVSAREMVQWLDGCTRPLAIINCASASGPFINRLSGENRAIVTASKSGFEYNFARFGQHMARAIGSSQADLDKDEQTSLLEAFIAASAKVAEFYEQEGRLATEHALVDDNGDGLGTPADWFRGVRATRTPQDGKSADGLRANQLHLIRTPRDANLSETARVRRDELERHVSQLRDKKATLSANDYYGQLEVWLLELARLYESETRTAESP